MIADGVGIDFREEDFFLIGGGLGDEFAHGAGDEGSAPEFEALATGGGFVADAVDRGHVAAVGDGVAALDDFP